ncbi:hypothetical protein BKA70DRAFT_1538700, partial [Coprinopsis sp. MPI-PUGE-AT-0042]
CLSFLRLFFCSLLVQALRSVYRATSLTRQSLSFPNRLSQLVAPPLLYLQGPALYPARMNVPLNYHPEQLSLLVLPLDQVDWTELKSRGQSSELNHSGLNRSTDPAGFGTVIASLGRQMPWALAR